MRIEKETLGSLDKAYCLNFLDINGKTYAIAASEKKGGNCNLYDLKTGHSYMVWENRGGTMTISSSNDTGDILGVQNFFMGFQAETARLVSLNVITNQANSESIYLELPFIHRFGFINSKDRTTQYILICTVTTAKDDRDDWHRPGAVYAAEFNGPNIKPSLSKLISLHKNHGYWKGYLNHEEIILIAAEEGLFALHPPAHKRDSFHIEKIFDREVSDAVAIDIDNDGQDEIVAIEGFHGNTVTVNKNFMGEWKQVHHINAEFAHALWAGKIFGNESCIISHRKGMANLLMLQYLDGHFTETIIDHGTATPNIDVYTSDEKVLILATDRTNPSDEKVVIYSLFAD